MSDGTHIRKVFLVLEGGGARGLAHVGALRAIEEEPRLEIAGLGGTSAGAIVAALASAGYASTDMIDSKGTSPLLNQAGFDDATGLLGTDWNKVRQIRWLASNWKVPLGLFLLSCVVLPLLIGAWAGFPMGLVAAVSLIGLAALAVYRIASGIASTEPLEKALGKVLAENLVTVGPVSFGHGSLLPLRIVATDLSDRTGKLFSEQATPEQSVARAVSASVAIPFLFKPVVIDARHYCDGGIISNLPIWAFDEDRVLDPDALTIAIEIPENDSPADLAATVLGRIKALFRAVVFGSAFLNKRMVDGLEVFRMPLPDDLGVLSFDIEAGAAATIVEDARRYTRLQIVQRLIEVPDKLDQACAAVHEFVMALHAVEVPPGDEGVLRVGIAERSAEMPRIVRIFAAYNYDGQVDDRLGLPVEGSILGQAVASGEPSLTNVAEPEIDPQVAMNGNENRYRRGLAWGEIKWIFALPIKLDDREFVVSVDSNIAIEQFYLQAMTEAELSDVARQIQELCEPALVLKTEVEASR